MTTECCPTILLVDDEPMILEALGGFFELEGNCEFAPFQCPLRALNFLERREVDLVISDFLMPGIDGLEFLTRVRTLDPLVPRVLLTGYADKDNALRAINEAGLFHYIEKPWSNDDLRLVIGNALEKRRLMRRLTEQSGEFKKAHSQLDELRGELLRSFG